MKLLEIFSARRTFDDIQFTTENITATAEINGRTINFEALLTDRDSNAWSIYFDEDGSMEATGSGGEFEVFGYAKSFVEVVLKQTRAKKLVFEVDDQSKSREKLYDRLLKRFTTDHGFTLDKLTNKHGTIIFSIHRADSAKPAK